MGNMAQTPSPIDANAVDDTARYSPLVVVLVAACAGIVADRFGGIVLAAWWTIAGGALVAWAGFWYCRWRWIGCVLLLVSIAATAAGWHHCWWNLFADDDLGRYAGIESQPVCIEAVARKAPKRLPAPPYNPMRVIPRGDRTRVEVDVVRFRNGTQWQPCSGSATLTVEGHLLGVSQGDRLQVFGSLNPPSPAANPGDFDYAAFCRADRRLSLLRASYPDCVSTTAAAEMSNVGGIVSWARKGSRRLLSKYVDQQQSGLAQAVLLGAREQLDQQQWEAFFETGTVHLLAISGLHVGIVAWMLFLLLRVMRASRGRAALIVATATIFYAILTDARPPAIRATILVLVFCLGSYLGRRLLAFNTLAAAGLIVLAMNPADLFRVGTQLSFLAVAGLAWFAPHWIRAGQGQDPLDRLIAKSRGRMHRKGIVVGRSTLHLLLVGTVIWVLALPLVMARFHIVSPVALGLNMYLWLPMAAALACGFGVLTFGWLAPPLAALFGRCCGWMLACLQWGIDTAREVPGSHFWVPGPDNWWLAGFYGGLALMVAVPSLRPPRRWLLALAAGWIGVGMSVSWMKKEIDRLDCTFLSVGHGCAVVVQLPDGRTILVDAGSQVSPEYCARSVAAFLWSEGITHLDAVVLTHADADHYNALGDLLRQFSVGVVYTSPTMFDRENESAALAELKAVIVRAGVSIETIHRGNRLRAPPGCMIEVLNPPERGFFDDDNANSIVLMLQWHGQRILLTGDLEDAGLQEMLEEEPMPCDVLLVPHHGSRRSIATHPAALGLDGSAVARSLPEWSRPKVAIVSGGRSVDMEVIENAYGAVGAEVLDTARCGAIRTSLSADELEIDWHLDWSKTGP